MKPSESHLEEDGHGGDLLGVRLEAVAEVAAVRQIQPHDALVRLEKPREHLRAVCFADCMRFAGLQS